MAAPTLCNWNKCGHCKFSERLRKHHENQICKNQNFRRCEFSPCSFKHENGVLLNDSPAVENEMKVIADKIVALDIFIGEKSRQIEEMSTKILNLENKLTESELKEITMQNEMKEHKFDKHTMQYGKELLQDCYF